MNPDRIRHWEDDAPAVAICVCGGSLMLVEDDPPLPIEAQCAKCGELTGVSRDAAQLVGPAGGTPEDLGF